MICRKHGVRMEYFGQPVHEWICPKELRQRTKKQEKELVKSEYKKESVKCEK